MNGTKALLSSVFLVTLAAGCQQGTVYTPADVAPSEFILGLTPKQSVPAQAPSAAQIPAAESYSAPPIVYEDAAEPQPVYTAIETVDPVAPVLLESETGFVEDTSFVTDSAAPEMSYSEVSAPEITYIDEAQPSPVVDTTTMPEPVYVIESELPSAGSPELVSESEIAVLDAPILDNDIVPVLGDTAAPSVIESVPLPQTGVTTYGQAF